MFEMTRSGVTGKSVRSILRRKLHITTAENAYRHWLLAVSVSKIIYLSKMGLTLQNTVCAGLEAIIKKFRNSAF